MVQHNITIKTPTGELHTQAATGENLMKLLNRMHVELDAPCGGRHFCGKCRIVVQGDAGQLHSAEKVFFSLAEIAEGWRLACASTVQEDLTIIMPKEGAQAKILDKGGKQSIFEVNPLVRTVYVEVDAPSLEKQTSDVERLRNALGLPNVIVPPNLMAELPRWLRENQGSLYVTLLGESEVLSVNTSLANEYGVAVDVGTTTMVAYLMNMRSGEQLDVQSMLNPQKLHGADVISRTDYTIENPKGLREMAELVCSAIKDMAHTMAKRQNIAVSDIRQVLPVGNTIMMHLLFALPTEYIAKMPFVPAYSRGFSIQGGLGAGFEHALLNATPCVAGYVGADTLAAIVSCDMDQSRDITLLIDIGTNGEIVLGNQHHMVCCSAAAGPAFEGAHIQFGMGGVAGAIDSVSVQNGQIHITSIGNQKPIGICGSGLVDAISVMKDLGIIDETGRIDEDEVPDAYADRLIEVEGKPAFLLFGEWKDGIYISQKDLREVQLAKGAIAAGIQVLMESMDIPYDQITNLYLAGGFGNYIDKHSACNIGLLPSELENKIEAIGNGAGAGAQRMLLSREFLNRTEYVREKMQYIELSAREDFQDLFVENMFF